MAADFTSIDDMIYCATTLGQVYSWDYFKAPQFSMSNGFWYSLYDRDGVPGPASNPAAGGSSGAGGTIRTSANGFMTFPDQSGRTKRLTYFGGFNYSFVAEVVLYDRLCDASGIALHTSTGLKNVGTQALPRFTTGEGVECWLEITVAPATTAPICNIRYTDSTNTSRQGASVTFQSAVQPVRSMVQMSPIAGGASIKSVESLDVTTVSGGSTATCNVVLMKPIARLALQQNVFTDKDFGYQVESFPVIPDGASLGFMMVTPGGTSQTFQGRIVVVHS